MGDRLASPTASLKILARDEVISFIERTDDSELKQLNPQFVASLAKNVDHVTPLAPEKWKFILEKMNLDVPEPYKNWFIQLMLQHHDAFSANKYYLGRSNTLLHEIELHTQEPVYIKQFKILDAHREEVEKHISKWLKLGVIQPTRSKFNCPIFVVAKKNEGLQIVQDFRVLNQTPRSTNIQLKMSANASEKSADPTQSYSPPLIWPPDFGKCYYTREVDPTKPSPCLAEDNSNGLLAPWG